MPPWSNRSTSAPCRAQKSWFYVVLFAVAGAAVLCASSANAIINGEVDNDNAFANVGALVLVHPVFNPDWPALSDPPAHLFCGVLIHPRVMVTAGHGVEEIEFAIAAGAATLDDLRVSFSPNSFDPDSWREIAAVLKHPDYNFQTLDIGVIILKEPVEDVAPVELPPVLFLDDLADVGLLPHKAPFAIAGYGATSHRAFGKDPPDGQRRLGVNGLNKLLPDVLRLKSGDNNTHAYYQDSGSPAFWIDPHGGDPVFAGVFSSVNPHSYDRVDLPLTRQFLKDILDAVEDGVL